MLDDGFGDGVVLLDGGLDTGLMISGLVTGVFGVRGCGGVDTYFTRSFLT